MSKITELAARLAEPVVAAQGCSLWDVEYVKEAGAWYLRIYIDKDGGVSINDCETISRAVSDLLDEADPIEGSYTFEVSSAGADRALKKPEHFRASLGEEVDIKLYQAVDGKKAFTGVLTSYDEETGAVALQLGDQAAAVFEKKEIAQVRLHVSF